MKAIKKKDDSDFIVKIVIIGDSGVGKTNILLRYCDDAYRSSYVATIGVDFKVKVMQVEGYKIKLQIWDTAGQQRYKNINQTYYRGAIGIILAYSVVDLQSYNNVENWMKQIHENATSDVLKFLVGNKIDLGQRKVDYSMGEKLAKKYGMQFMQVSAKDGSNITKLFKELGTQIYHQIKNNNEEDKVQRISITKQSYQENNKRTCNC